MRRYLVATGVTTELVTSGPLIEESVETMVRLFTGTFGYTRATGLGLDPGIQEFRDELRAFCEERDPDDLVVLYHTGHAGIVTRRHKLWMGDTRNPVSGALATYELAELMLDDTPLSRAMIIIDSCHAGEGGAEALLSGMVAMDRDDKTLVVVTAAHPKEQIRAGEFAKLFGSAVHHPATAGHEPRYLSTAAIVERIMADPARAGSQSVAESVLFRQSELEPFLPNPRYDTLLHGRDLLTQLRITQDEARRQDMAGHFLPRARGVQLPHETSWRFVGREAVLGDLVTWLRTPADTRARVVTGDPGSGKSAVIGRLAVLSDPDWRAAVPRDDLPAGVVPPPGAIRAAVHARGLTSIDVLAALGAAVGVPAKTAGALAQALGGRSLVVAIDAVDEAVDPDKIVDEILRPLIEDARGLRLLLGTRWHLVDRLGTGTVVLDLDSERYADPGSLRRYTERVLVEGEPGSPYASAPAGVLSDVADAVAEAAGRSFLVALIAARTLASVATVPADRGTAWRSSLPGTAAQAMHQDLETRLGPEAGRARDLLTPLAFAQGAGLPWAGMWAPLAAHLSGRDYRDEDLVWLRRAAGAYVVEALESGLSVYRLYHSALAEYLRGPWDAGHVERGIVAFLRGRAGPAWGKAPPYVRSHLATHAALAHRLDELVTDPDYLLAVVPAPLLAALPYAEGAAARAAGAVYRRVLHLLRHVSRAEGLSYLELGARRAEAGELAERIAGLEGRRPWVPLWAQWPYEAPHRVLTGHEGPVTDLAAVEGRGESVRVMSAGADRTLRTWDVRTGEQLEVRRLGEASPARLLLDAGDGAAAILDQWAGVSVWDLRSGEPRWRRRIDRWWRLVINRRLGGYIAHDLGELGGRPVVVTTGLALRTTAWDLVTGERLVSTTAESLTQARTEEGHTLVFGKEKRQAWDLEARRWVPRLGWRRWNRDVNFGGVDNTAILAGRELGDRIALWDVRTGRWFWKGFTETVGEIPMPDGRRLVAIDDEPFLDGRPFAAVKPVAVTREPVGEVVAQVQGMAVRLTGHRGEITGHVAVTLPSGVRAEVTSGEDATVRVWELDSSFVEAGTADIVDIAFRLWATVDGGRALGAALGMGEELAIYDLRTGADLVTIDAGEWAVFTLAAGALVAFTWDQSCVIVEPGSGAAARTFPADPLRFPTCAAASGGFALTGGHTNNAVLWDLAVGKAARVLRGHTRPVLAVALGRLAEGGRVAVTAGADGRIGVWDLDRRRRSWIRMLPWWRRLLTPPRSVHHLAHAATAAGSVVLLLAEPGAAVQVYTGARPGGRYRRARDLVARAVAFAVLGEVAAVAETSGVVGLWRLGAAEPYLRIELEAEVHDLVLAEPGLLWVATDRGLAAFEVELP
ncbi:WD40 repeat domain-containing protein [Nonomuraea typhae]|uniref:WD40 repeat domain-containing protein n=1 Tax=Nonomuraea typhae TaxID=2603600 RepID=UPI0012FB8E2C|nr:WD40 repeat domain-containing protein [Nonomuraea typhae]